MSRITKITVGLLLLITTSCFFEKEVLPTIKWGATPEEIGAREKGIIGTLIQKTDSMLSFETKLFKFRASVRYYFEENKLINTEYLLLSRIRNGEYINTRNQIITDVSKLFGNPIENTKISNEEYVRRFFDSEHEAFQAGYVNYVTIWENQTTIVKILVRGGQKHATIRVQLLDKIKFPLVKETEVTTEVKKDDKLDTSTDTTSSDKE